MSQITKDEVLKIAELSRLQLQEQDIDGIVKQLDDVLSYAQSVQDIAQKVDVDSGKTVNHSRPDKVVSSNPDAILDQAPQAEDHYFVVPKILDN